MRTYANLPDEVPDAVLTVHLAVALRDLGAAVGAATCPTGGEAPWKEAHIVRTLVSVYPHLHTFVLSGAARAGRLTDAPVEFRFQLPDEVDKAIARLDGRFSALAAQLRALISTETDAAPGPVWMGAI